MEIVSRFKVFGVRIHVLDATGPTEIWNPGLHTIIVNIFTSGRLVFQPIVWKRVCIIH